MGVDLVVCPVDLVEDVLADESPWQTARRLALSKLQLARQRDRNATVLTADTVVDLDGVALGKPVSEAEAWWMLRDLRGRTHRVHTAVAAGKPGIEACVVSTSRVWMREYTDAEIAAYIAAREPFDKAGAYGIHNLRFGPVRAVRGLYTTVLGLPAPPAARLLSRLGVPNSYDASLEIELRSHL